MGATHISGRPKKGGYLAAHPYYTIYSKFPPTSVTEQAGLNAGPDVNLFWHSNGFERSIEKVVNKFIITKTFKTTKLSNIQ